MKENEKVPYTSLCIIVPVYNEEDNIEFFTKTITEILKKKYKKSFTILFVNDASRDNSLEIIAKLAKKYPQVNYVNLARNFGQDKAIFAGLDSSNGEVIAIVDCDNQDPPLTLIDMLKKQEEEDLDTVLAQRSSRKGETKFSLFLSNMFYKIFCFVSDVDLPPNTGYFRVMRESVKDEVIKQREQNSYLPGLIAWVGFKWDVVLYNRNSRHSGTSNYKGYFSKLLLAFDAITSFSIAPLRVASLFSFLLIVLSFIIGVYSIMSKLFFDASSGWTSLMCVVLFVGSLNSLLLGIIGEYVGRIYIQTKQRSIYTVMSKNFQKTIVRKKTK